MYRRRSVNACHIIFPKEQPANVSFISTAKCCIQSGALIIVSLNILTVKITPIGAKNRLCHSPSAKGVQLQHTLSRHSSIPQPSMISGTSLKHHSIGCVLPFVTYHDFTYARAWPHVWVRQELRKCSAGKTEYCM